jgi:hypothetical protein
MHDYDSDSDEPTRRTKLGTVLSVAAGITFGALAMKVRARARRRPRASFRV